MNESTNRGSRKSSVMESRDPISMLKGDHKNVKALFDQFEGTDDERTQMQVARKALDELKVHAAIEEEIFYPAVEAMVDDAEVMAEATQEHHVVHFLIDELERGNLDHDTFHAKFIVLAENVRHHIKEEEGEMMPKIDRDKTKMGELASRMAERKQELMQNPDAIRQTGKRPSSKGSSRSAGSRQSSNNSSRNSAKGSTQSRSGGNRKSNRSSSRPASNPRASR